MRDDVERAVNAEQLNVFGDDSESLLGWLGVGLLTVSIGGGLFWYLGYGRYNQQISTDELRLLVRNNIYLTENGAVPPNWGDAAQHPIPLDYVWIESDDRATGVLGAKRVEELMKSPAHWTFWTARNETGKVLDLPWYGREYR